MNFLPPRVPVTIVWNKHLPQFDSTREDQEFKAFADLPSDLPFRYGSLTALRTSFRPWLGSAGMPAFVISGLEFFAITRMAKFNSQWRNPAGTWFRQIIPTGAQLIHLMQEIQNECIEINAHVPDYDYEDDSLEGRITLSAKGVHLAPIYMLSDYGVYPAPKTVDPRSSAIRFEEGEFVTSLTQVIHPRVVGSMVLNAFAHAAGLEVGSFFDASAPPISAKLRE
jgi:hypothetical protein